MILADQLFIKIQIIKEISWLQRLLMVVFAVEVSLTASSTVRLVNEKQNVRFFSPGAKDPGINLLTAPYVDWIKRTAGTSNFFCTYP